MTDTVKLGLPMVQAAQAQKHVTVNEALIRIDALAQLDLAGIDAEIPPANPAEGEVYALGANPSGDWIGQGGMLALRKSGGWSFARPRNGWRAWDAAAGIARRHADGVWLAEHAAATASGAATRNDIVEIDLTLTSGGAISTGTIIPAGAQVIGVSGRVIAEITGAGVTGWRLGVAGSDNRYGSGLGIALNSWARGLTGQPLTYYSDTELLISPEGASDFAGGQIRLAVHLIALTPPAEI